MVLARIHDPVGGMDINADEKLENHLENLLTASGTLTVPAYVCFACPKQENDFSKFLEHCNGRSHQKAMSGKFKKILKLN